MWNKSRITKERNKQREKKREICVKYYIEKNIILSYKKVNFMKKKDQTLEYHQR